MALVSHLMPERVSVAGDRSELKRWVIRKIPNTRNRTHCRVAGRNPKLLTASPKTGRLPIDSGDLHVAADEDGMRGICSHVSKLVGIPAPSQE